MVISKEGEVVCVTGASGFIGSRLVHLLPRRGYTVRATVKDLGDERETKHLEAFDGADSRLRLFQIDLLPGTSTPNRVASPCFIDENTPAAGRHLCVESLSRFIDIAQQTERLYPEFKLPRFLKDA